MSTVRRIAKNTGLLFIASIITYILGFFTTIYTANYLGVEGFGIISTALALTGIFSVFTDLGISTLTVREVARDKKIVNKYVENTAIIKLILAIITFGLIAIFAFISGYSEVVKYVIYIITISVIFNSYSGILNSIFQAFEEMEHQSIGIIINSVVMLVGTLIAIYFHANVIVFASIYLISTGITFIYLLIIYAWKFSFPKVEIDLNFWKPVIKEALPLSITSIFAILIFRVDTVMLSLMKGVVAVGWYNAAYKLMEALIFIPSVYTTSIFPFLSSMYISSKKPIITAYEKSFKYLIILSLPIAVGTTLLADQIILLIYKSGFTESILALQILIWVLPFTFLNYILGSLLTSINKQYTVLKITIVVLIFNVGLNLILIPQYSYLGAAFATVISDAIAVILSFYVVSQLISKIKVHKVLLKPAIASAIMGLFLFFVKLNLLLEILIATTIYFVVLIGIKTFTDKDYDLFKQIISRNKN
ncbi:flippase [Methanobacterium sp. ACI-7]|uniref:flippase n=1 Tax=unclassified Methanobacterium TaxID=2627676 RepID=UPI0039C2D7C3